MNKKQLIVAWVVGILLLSGCNSLRTFPLYSEVWVEHPEYIELFEDFNIDYFVTSLPDSDVTKKYLRTKAQVSDYLNKHKDIAKDIFVALKELKIKRGMTKEQVILLTGEPTKKKIMRDKSEQWIYKEDRELRWYYGWGKLKFENDFLIDIEVQYINIYK